MGIAAEEQVAGIGAGNTKPVTVLAVTALGQAVPMRCRVLVLGTGVRSQLEWVGC